MPKPDKPRLLAPTGCHRRFVDEHAYVEFPGLAMRDEPEALTEQDYKLHVQERSRFQERLRREAMLEQARQHRQTLTIEQRIVEARRQAKLKHVNISGELWLIGVMLERAKRGGRQEPVSAHEKMSQVEAVLDGPESLPDAA